MALTGPQRAAIRIYCGWPSRFYDNDSRLEQAMLALDNQPDHLAQVTNALTGDPPGILALLGEVDQQLRDAVTRLQASKVGSIELNPAEMSELRNRGRMLTARLCSLLGVDRKEDVFSNAVSNSGGHAGLYSMGGGGGYPDGYVGK